MQEQRFTEKDWKLFRSKIADWQESFMDRLNTEYIAILSKDANPSDKFWELEKRIKEDKKKAGVQVRMSRSNLIYNLISLLHEGAISFEDLEEFSDGLKETVGAFIDRQFGVNEFLECMHMEWNATLYDNKHDFVAEYGKGLLEFVPKNDEQSILDLGCGTGTLTAQLAELCNKIVGVDGSQDMIDKAKEEFSNIEFKVCDALDLPFEKEFDVVFSNAVFHWISDHDALLKNIHKALKPQGVLVCEFGASGNIAMIENAFAAACNSFGYGYEAKFNFPMAEDFGKLLEDNGFVIDRIYDYDRPTVLKDGEQGLVNWMKQFYASELQMMPEQVQTMVFEKVERLTRDTLWNGAEWVADYRRLRAIAHI